MGLPSIIAIGDGMTKVVTKFGHACVRIDDGDRAIVIDPGPWSEPERALDGVRAILITHEHFDHLDVDAVLTAAHRDPELLIWAPRPVAEQLATLGDRIVPVQPGTEFEAGGFQVAAYGGQHEIIHPSIPVVDNIAYWVDGIYHPGDSFTVPTRPTSLLCVPLQAPWSTSGQVIDFTIAVRAPRAFQIHEYLLTDFGRDFCERRVSAAVEPYDIDFFHLDSLSSTEL